MATNLQSKLGLGLVQAQTSNMDAAAYNSSHTSDPGRVQIQGGTEVGSSGGIGSQALSPASLSTPTAQSQQLSAPISAPTTTGAPVSGGGTTPSVSGGNPGSAQLGSAPVGMKTEKVKSMTGTQAPTTNSVDVGQLGISSTQPLSLLQIRDQIKAENPTLKPMDIMKQARQQFDAQKNVVNPANGLPEIPKTGISAVDIAQQKLRDETLQKVKDTYKGYSIAQADYQKNAGYYTNFDGTNGAFNKVMGDIQNTLANTKQPTLSDQEIAVIAARNGVTVDQVKNPLSIYNNLQMTDEGKQVLGVTNQENQINDMKTNNDRLKEDAKVNLDRQTTNLNYQIQDAERQMKQTTDWMTASGAWNGAGRSSGYEKGIQNIKDDTGRIVERINEQIGNLNTDNAKYLSRVTEDFTTNVSRATTQLTQNINDLKHQTGLTLNGLEEKYGKGSKDLLKQLNSIYEQFGISSLDINGKYLDQVSKIQNITSENLSLIDKMNTVTSALKNKRYNELTANNGALLQNISLSNVADEVKAGHMDLGKYSDVRNLMISTVTNGLAKNGAVVSQEMLNTITHLIDNGATPSQVISRVGGGNLQTPQIDATSIADYSTQKRGKTNLQCGELTNDYWEQMTGSAISHDPAINTYQGKVSAIKKIGESSIPQVGGVFVLNTGNSTGHIGIVQQVNSDGSIVVLEANRQNSANGGAPMLGTYTAEQLKNMTFSKSPTDMNSQGNQTVTPGTTQNRPDKNKNPGNLKGYGNNILNIPGAVGVDDQNHIIFSNETDGYNAMVKDLTAKMTGNSSQVSKLTGQPLGPDSTLADLASVYAEDPNWVNNVAQISGYSKDAKLSTLDVNKLGPAIARAEGFTGKITAQTTPSVGRQYSIEEKAVMDDYLKNPSDPANQKTMQQKKLGSADITAYQTQKNAPETPNEKGYRLSDYTTRIRNLLPAGQADQPGEQAKIEKLAQQYIQDGLSPEQASLKYIGFNIKDDKNTQLATQMRNAMQNLKTPPKGYEQKLSDMINAGKTTEAYNFVNANIDRDVKDMYGDKAILTQNFESSQNRINKIVNLIEKNRDKIGAFDGPFTDFVKKFKNEPEYQELKTLQTMAQADIRKYFAGSAVTDTEMKALEDFIGGTTKMQPDNLITQLKTIQNDVKDNYGYQRQVYGLDSNNSVAEKSPAPVITEATNKLRSYIQKFKK